MALLDQLNPAQRQAAEAVEGPVLVFAGAGSGKTRALTYRIAHMVCECGIAAKNILAVTFTNKAANEMRQRIRLLVGDGGRGLWAGTFHSMCARMLRADGQAIGISENYAIYDDGDQLSLIKQSMSVLDIDSKQYKPADVLYSISAAKNELVGPQQYRHASKGPFDDVVRRTYSLYQQKLRENNALDFDDLLMRTVQLLRERPEVLEKYQDVFHYILVDEYQDINGAQYEFVKLLASRRRNICVVGDDDQSIYGWRGANVGIILDFEKDYPDARVVKLEQNYRSTQKILECAYAVISQNSTRAEKKLWTENRPGDNLTQYQAVSAEEEAEWVVGVIDAQIRGKLAQPGDYAVLYRANAMSRVFEEAFMRARLPYELVGGVKYYERAVIKDFLAYLRVIHNPVDSVSLQRIINTPTRGIGDKTLAVINRIAHLNSCSPYEALRYVANFEDLQKRAREAVGDFHVTMEQLREKAQTLPLTELCRAVAEDSGYLRALEQSGSADDARKAEDLKEFVSLAQRFEEREEEPTLQSFLEFIALVSDLDQAEDLGSKVCLMTMHAAKGLEFPIVFMVGMEEGLFPHQRSMADEYQIEEERRLCYVGITRAQSQLYLTHAHRRTIYGEPRVQTPSRFLADLPDELVDRQVDLSKVLTSSVLGDDDEVTEERYGEKRIDLTDILSRIRHNTDTAKTRTVERIEQEAEEAERDRTAKERDQQSQRDRRKQRAERPQSAAPVAVAGIAFKAGDRVSHPKFGIGVVVAVSGSSNDLQLKVAFPNSGVKDLAAAYAPLERA